MAALYCRSRKSAPQLLRGRGPAGAVRGASFAALAPTAVQLLDQVDQTQGRAMFSVKWVVAGNETMPVEVETNFLQAPVKLVAVCQRRLPAMRLKHPETPPDGFIVFDSEGEEVHRYLGLARTDDIDLG